MKLEWIKTPKIIKRIFSKHYWDIPNKDNSVYLTFDDGPIPEVTPWVLSELEKHEAKATFFCIGENIEKHPQVFRQVIEAGHSVGNHTYNHLNGWNTTIREYVKNIEKCQEILRKTSETSSTKSELLNLFRPPYGKIRPRQARFLRKKGYKIIMWDVLSADYDVSLSGEECLRNIIRNVESGSIIVFHDSLKAFPRLEYILPRVLQFLDEKNYCLKTL